MCYTVRWLYLLKHTQLTLASAESSRLYQFFCKSSSEVTTLHCCYFHLRGCIESRAVMIVQISIRSFFFRSLICFYLHASHLYRLSLFYIHSSVWYLILCHVLLMSASGARHLAACCCERPVFFTPGTAGDLSPKVFCVYVLFCFWILVQQIWPPVFKASQTDETQPPCCRLSQTGLCCHGNMLWRSSYWDSAGWQVTVLAVRVFGPLSLPQTSCPLWEPAPRSSLQSNRGLPLSRLECTLCLCIGLCVFVCSKKMDFLT